jgi:hypothetical protein
MKIIKSTTRPNGVTRMIIELDRDEGIRAISIGQSLLNIDPNAFYRLGQPMSDDVVGGYILADAVRVHWCSIEQKWRDD